MVIKFFQKKIYTFLIIIFISLFLVEISAKILVKLGFLNKGLPTWVTLRAHEDFATWHPKNSSFIIENKNCWVSKTSYNSLGMRDTFNFNLKNGDQNVETIALLGDSMIENIEVEDGLDLGSSIQNKIKSHKVLNFATRSEAAIRSLHSNINSFPARSLIPVIKYLRSSNVISSFYSVCVILGNPWLCRI